MSLGPVPFTVLGATGFIGGRLVRHLRERHVEVFAPARGSDEIWSRDLGHVLYCVGLTADWRQRPLDAVHAHVGHLLEVVERAQFQSLLYLSSTRIYKRVAEAHEDSPLIAHPAEPDDLFDLSKMMGESICAAGPPTTRVVRLSNVFGDDWASDNFLPSILRDALSGEVVLRSSPESAKDYVSVDDVVGLLPRIAVGGKARVYNVAGGRNTSNAELLAAIAASTGCVVRLTDGAPTITFPQISIDRVEHEFGFAPTPVLDAIGPLVDRFRARPN